MTREADPLRYESSIPGALEPGEVVFFECKPDPALIRDPMLPRALLVVFISLMVAFAAGSVTSDATVTTVASVLSLFLVGVTVFVGARGDRRLQRDLEHTTFRVTDRRIVRMDDRPGRERLEVHVSSFGQTQLARRRRETTVTVGATTFAKLPDPGRFELAVMDVVARSGRRRHLRRSPSHDAAASRTNATVQQQSRSTLPDGLMLAADEKVLWTGRPRVRENLDVAFFLGPLHIAAWLLVPLAFLLSALGMLKPWIGRVHFFFGFAAAFLLLTGLYSMLIAPFVHALRRKRTSYVLTNLRAIVHIRRGRRTSVTDSYLLDMAGMTELKERSDGTGDVWLSAGAMFERIDNPREVHLLVLEAIRNAGTPIAPPDLDDEFN